jgi:flagellin
MSLSILNNISALTAQNQLSITQKSLQNTLTQLSSGLKINSGADDAAGLSIANGMQANIAALTQSAQNATNGTGMLQTADGALSQITNLLNRAVTLATEASNGGLNATQSTALNTEFQSILNEITSIGTTTTFNGAAIFKAGTTPNYSEFQAGSGLTGSTGIDANNLDLTLGGTTLSGYTGSVATTIKGSTTVADLIKNINDNSATLKVSASLTSDGKLVLDDTTKSGTISSKFAMTGLKTAAYTATQSSAKVVVMGSNLTGSSLIDTTGFAATYNGTAITTLRIE